ncbi:hypothetical protein PLICRDRAFT_160498 [Plicaturopsis crispa FD-325 SS-3]|nr:hypothetical protein PLICRDRAFT_160498 [Plicaturopsis crispa FD-325 SS-3]
MGWFTSLFSPEGSTNSRRGQAMSSTHEAFSLPTSSPGFVSHPDAFNPDMLNNLEPDSATSASFTYPPQSSGAYNYVPTSSRSRPSSLLPLHHTSASPTHPYPPLPQTWARLRAWLAREYPELGDTLNYGILPPDLATIEMQFGFSLPAVVRESYLCADGQEAESAAGCSEGLFFGLTLLPLEDVLDEWRFWREVDSDPATGANPRLREAMRSIPPGWVRAEYSQRGWIPLIADRAGNYVGVDLNPGESGAVGQVIVFGRDYDTKVVLYRGDGPAGWAKWLASFVEELESGEGYELGQNEASEGSEDGVGYESYFFDGSGRGSGDGGGETGPGGLRLAGEYRGWSVLDAWADRSIRRWHEAGVIPDPAEENVEEKKSQLGGVLDFAAASSGTGAEVPIPLLAEASDAPSSALNNVANTSPRPPPPTISITKPPAPLPVDLPTPRDLVALPSPPDSTRSSDDFDRDLESGGPDLELGRGMRQPPREEAVVRRSTPSNADASGSQPESLVTLTPAVESSSQTAPSRNNLSDITDLLSDSTEVLEGAAPITPSSPAPSKSPETPSVPIPEPEAAPAVTEEPVTEEPESETAADTTIRLIGGGGVVGTAQEDEDETAEDAEPDAASEVTSVKSSDSVQKTGKHEKKKSISSGIKKLGKMGGGKRKKDSVSSLKDATAA